MLSIAELWIYPVKSCAGIRLESAHVGETGLDNDRLFMIVDETGLMMTQRDYAQMGRIHTQIDRELRLSMDGDSLTVWWGQESDHRMRTVKVWDDTLEALDMGDHAAGWLSDHIRVKCRLVKMSGGVIRKTRRGEGRVAFSDGYPGLGISDASLADLNSRMAAPLPMKRFRPNFVFAGATPYAEDHWRRIAIGKGEVELIGETLCARCSIPRLDPETGLRGKEPDATLAGYRRVKHDLGPAWKTPYPNNVYFGRNLNVKGWGMVRVGDLVAVLEFD